MKKIVKLTVCFIILIFFILHSLNRLVLFHEDGNFLYYKLEENVSMETADLIQRTKAENMPDLVLWDYLDNQSVSITSPIKREYKASVVTICGNPAYIFGNFSIPQYGDMESCLLDERTAWKLFGTRDAVGESVIYEDKKYKIKGILEDIEPTLVIQAAADYAEGFGRMIIPQNNVMGEWQLENSIMNRYGIKLIKTDWRMVKSFVKIFFCIMILSIYSFVFRKFCQYKKIHDKIVSGSFWLGGLLFAAGLLWMTGVRGISTEYIPYRWSDFGYYREIWNSLSDAFKDLLRLNLSTFELRMLHNSFVLCLYILLAGLIVRYMLSSLCDT